MDQQYAAERAALCLNTAKEQMEMALVDIQLAQSSDNNMQQAITRAGYATRLLSKAQTWQEVAQKVRTR